MLTRQQILKLTNTLVVVAYGFSGIETVIAVYAFYKRDEKTLYGWSGGRLALVSCSRHSSESKEVKFKGDGQTSFDLPTQPSLLSMQCSPGRHGPSTAGGGWKVTSQTIKKRVTRWLTNTVAVAILLAVAKIAVVTVLLLAAFYTRKFFLSALFPNQGSIQVEVYRNNFDGQEVPLLHNQTRT